MLHYSQIHISNKIIFSSIFFQSHVFLSGWTVKWMNSDLFVTTNGLHGMYCHYYDRPMWRLTMLHENRSYSVIVASCEQPFKTNNESNLCHSVGRTRPGWCQLKGTGSPLWSWRRLSILFLPCLDRSSWTLGSLRSVKITFTSVLALNFKIYHEIKF